MDTVSSRAAAYHQLHLLSEALVDQSIYNRVDSGVEHDQCVGNIVCCITKGKRGSMKVQDVANRDS